MRCAIDAGRKHLAPVGALRHERQSVTDQDDRQEAPRTCRCIKTCLPRPAQGQFLHGRKHLAPVGALRLLERSSKNPMSYRQEAPRTCRCIKTLQKQRYRASISGQQAPRTCRCIKTTWRPLLSCNVPPVSKHRAPVGALRRPRGGVRTISPSRSASTAHL